MGGAPCVCLTSSGPVDTSAQSLSQEAIPQGGSTSNIEEWIRWPLCLPLSLLPAPFPRLADHEPCCALGFSSPLLQLHMVPWDENVGSLNLNN